MCSECFQTPCHPRCPNADEPRAVHACAQCGEDILEGDDCYHIGEDYFCEDCVRDFKEEAVFDEIDEF